MYVLVHVACQTNKHKDLRAELVNSDSSLIHTPFEILKIDTLTIASADEDEIKAELAQMIAETPGVPAPEIFENKLAYQKALIQYTKELKGYEIQIEEEIHNRVLFPDTSDMVSKAYIRVAHQSKGITTNPIKYTVLSKKSEWNNQTRYS